MSTAKKIIALKNIKLRKFTKEIKVNWKNSINASWVMASEANKGLSEVIKLPIKHVGAPKCKVP